MKCSEGLIYDKNLRSCAIPSDDWDCIVDDDNNNDPAKDDSNIYDVQNLEILNESSNKDDDDSYLEVINGEKTFDSSSVKSDESDTFSGDGAFDLITPATPTALILTTQLQRLTQLMKRAQEKSDGIQSNIELSPDDLNSFLSLQKINAKSPEYQQIDFHSDDKTIIAKNGGIHPEILSHVLDTQNRLNSGNLELTTLAMDATTPRTLPKPFVFLDREPFTEIKLKSGNGIDGVAGSHQIVVNRPEGSVLFNVPAPVDQKHDSPYLSEHILKTVLELSKQMVKQNHQKPSPQISYAPQPIYYAVPFPVLSPQHNEQHFYTSNTSQAPDPTSFKIDRNHNKFEVSPPVSSNDEQSSSLLTSPSQHTKMSLVKKENLYPDNHVKISYQKQQQNYPNNYYDNYPMSTFNSYPNSAYQSYQQQYSPYNYQYNGQYANSPNYNQYQNSDIRDSGGNGAFVIEQSAPSYVDQHPNRPFRKESYASSYDDESYDSENMQSDSDNEHQRFSDPVFDEVESDSVKDELICSFVATRQANKTDCFRYYVCNAKTKEILYYTCPVFTAFNEQTRYCDSQSHAACEKSMKKNVNSLINNKAYADAYEALAQAKKESQKVERIANIVRQESNKIMNHRNRYSGYYDNQQQQQSIQQYPHFDQNLRISSVAPQRINRPTRPQKLNVKPKQQSMSSSSGKRKKKKPKCRDPGSNIPDPDSLTHYWHCFRDVESGRMKRMRKQCASNFVFCRSTAYCTSQNRC